MRKGLILEIKDGYAILVDSKGRFVRIKDKDGLQIGSEYETRGIFEMKKQIVTAIASLFLLSCIGGYGYTYASPKAYVALDINPSIKLTTNMYDKVIKIETLNEDAEVISKDLKIKNKDINEALKLLVASATDNGYIVKDSDNAIMVTATSEYETLTDEILNNAESAINEELESEEVKDIEIIKENINQERFDEAERLGISPGKMNLLEKLKVELPDINVDEYADKSVKEIMKKINEEKTLKREENKNIKKDESTNESTNNKKNDNEKIKSNSSVKSSENVNKTDKSSENVNKTDKSSANINNIEKANTEKVNNNSGVNKEETNQKTQAPKENKR